MSRAHRPILSSFSKLLMETHGGGTGGAQGAARDSAWVPQSCSHRQRSARGRVSRACPAGAEKPRWRHRQARSLPSVVSRLSDPPTPQTGQLEPTPGHRGCSWAPPGSRQAGLLCPPGPGQHSVPALVGPGFLLFKRHCPAPRLPAAPATGPTQHERAITRAATPQRDSAPGGCEAQVSPADRVPGPGGLTWTGSRDTLPGQVREA